MPVQINMVFERCCHIPFGISSFPCTSYVKWLEAAGARVVPVLVDTSGGLDQSDYFKEVGRTTSIPMEELLPSPW